ncbi:type I restriction enzyme, S subunit [Staphylococcus hominis]|uniref:restriction endonuclease subunit S n=1 Tax=Staphylococcus hominis TaxID=1290 RepID=UPI0030BA6C56
MEFEEVELGQISNVTKLAGYEFTNNIKYTNDGDIIAIRALNIKNGKLDLSQVKKITKETSNNLLRSKLYKNDIVLTYTGSKYGEVALINQNEKFHLAPNVCKVTVASNVNPYYIFLIMQTRSFKIQMKNFGVGSSQPTIPMKNIRKLKILLPSLEHQNKIVKLLKPLDEKIDLNYKLVTNLEELSQTIFKHWFINFEFPNQRNSSYNYNRKETSKDLPHGWKWEKLNHLFKINYGKNLPTKNLLDTGYPVYGGNGKIGYYSNYMYDDPKILISCRGAASGAIHVSQEHSFITNNSIVLDEIEKEYFYYFKELFSRETFKRYTTGSAQPQITIVNIKELKFLVPPKSLVIEFNKHQKPIFDFNSKLKQENSKLKSLRDTLLPKLMSGEIEIPDDIEVNMDEFSI